MAKYICEVCGNTCEHPDGCFRHRKRKPLSKGGRIRRKENNKGDKSDSEKQWELFMEVKNERIDGNGWLFCFETGQPIPKHLYNTTLIYHHLLEKEDNKYPQFKYEKWNIYTVLPDIHQQFHTDSAKTPKLKAERERLIKQLNI